MVRRRLEYCSPVWNPSKITEIEAIESVQRNFTRHIIACQQLDYWEAGPAVPTEAERAIYSDPYMEDGKRPCSRWHSRKTLDINNKSQRSVASHYECSETMDPSPTTSEH